MFLQFHANAQVVLCQSSYLCHPKVAFIMANPFQSTIHINNWPPEILRHIFTTQKLILGPRAVVPERHSVHFLGNFRMSANIGASSPSTTRDRGTTSMQSQAVASGWTKFCVAHTIKTCPSIYNSVDTPILRICSRSWHNMLHELRRLKCKWSIVTCPTSKTWNIHYGCRCQRWSLSVGTKRTDPNLDTFSMTILTAFAVRITHLELNISQVLMISSTR